jgi:putative DNA primase/helicase
LQQKQNNWLQCKSLHPVCRQDAGYNQIKQTINQGIQPMTEYNIPQNWATGTKIHPKECTVSCTVHPAPSTGWYKTNNLRHAQRRQVSLQGIVSSMLRIDNLAEDVADNGKITEHGKLEAGIFAPVTWSDMTGNRAKSKVDVVHAMVFDFDGLTDEVMQATLDAFKPFCHVAYSSFSHKSPAKKGLCAFRVVVPFDEPVPAADYITTDRRGVWYALESIFPHVDESTKDPSRFWFKPSYRADREGTQFTISNEGYTLSAEAVIDAGYAINTGAPTRRTSTVQDTEQEQNTQDTPQDTPQDTDRYRRSVVTGEHLITDATGERRPFIWYIQNWDTLQKNASGNIQCIADGGRSVGGAYIHRRVDTLTGIARYRCTSGRNRTHHDCIISDNGIEVSYSNRGGSWRPLDTPDNLVLMIGQLDIDLWMDKRTGYVWIDGDRFVDYHYTIVQSQLRRRFFVGRRLGKETTKDAVDQYCHEHQYDTLVEYLDGLQWDGQNRLDTLFIDYLNADDTAMIRTYTRKWAISAVARAYEWGCKVDTMLILKGLQGAGKSEFFKRIAGQCGRTGQSFFSDAEIDVHSVDGLTKLRLAWIHEWAELSGMNRSEVGDIKRFLTIQTDQYRPKYGRKEIVQDRHSVITGSVNEDEILKDSTGSRRFWIVECNGVEGWMSYDPAKLADIRDAIWSEAVHAYKSGEQWWLTPEEQQQSNHVNTKFEQVDVHHTLVDEWLDANPGKVFTLSEMIQDIYTEEVETSNGDTIRRSTAIRPKYLGWYSGCIKQLGATAMNDGKQCRYNGKRSRWYIAPERKDETSMDSVILTYDDGVLHLQIRLQGQTPLQARVEGHDWTDLDDLTQQLQDDIRQHYTEKYVLQYPARHHFK